MKSKVYAQPKEITFREESEPPINFRIIQKSPTLKFKINKKPNPGYNSERNSKETNIFDPISILRIKSLKDALSPPKTFNINGNIKSSLPFSSYTKPDNNNSPKASKMFQSAKKSFSKVDCKLTKVESIYTDCMDDLDTKFTYFNTKLQKILKKKCTTGINKEILDSTQNEEIKPKNTNKNKEKSKNFKNKTVMKIKQEIASQTMEDKAKFCQTYEFIRNKTDAKGLRKIFSRYASQEKLTEMNKMVIFNMDYTDFHFFFIDLDILNSFMEKIRDDFFIVLIVNTENEISDFEPNLYYIHSLFTNDPNTQLLDLKKMLGELDDIEGFMEYILIFNTIKTNPVSFYMNEIDNFYIFDGIFPQNCKKEKYQIDIIYFQSSVLYFTEILLEKINFLLEKSQSTIEFNSLENNDFVLLDNRKIYQNIQKINLNEKYFSQWHEIITKTIKKKPNLSYLNEGNILDEFLSFKKNVKKQKLKFNKKQLTAASLDILKMVSNDLIKRNINYFAKIWADPLSRMPDNEQAFKKMSNIHMAFYEKWHKIERKSGKFTKVRTFFLDISGY